MNYQKVDTINSIFPKTLIIIPAYNEEDTISHIVKGIKMDFADLDILVVDDGSTDNTCEVAGKAGAKVLSLINNMGYGIALQTAYKYAYRSKKYQYCLQLDGDGQHNYSDIPRLLGSLVENNVDLVIGSRFITGENGYNIPFARRVGISFFRMLVHLFTKNQIMDITSGFQAFNRDVLKFYTSDEMPYYYPDADVLILLIKGGYTIHEVATPMNGNNRKSMHSGISAQMYYVLTMILSIVVIILKGLRPKHV